MEIVDVSSIGYFVSKDRPSAWRSIVDDAVKLPEGKAIHRVVSGAKEARAVASFVGQQRIRRPIPGIKCVVRGCDVYVFVEQ